MVQRERTGGSVSVSASVNANPLSSAARRMSTPSPRAKQRKSRPSHAQEEEQLHAGKGSKKTGFSWFDGQGMTDSKEEDRGGAEHRHNSAEQRLCFDQIDDRRASARSDMSPVTISVGCDSPRSMPGKWESGSESPSRRQSSFGRTARGGDRNDTEQSVPGNGALGSFRFGDERASTNESVEHDDDDVAFLESELKYLEFEPPAVCAMLPDSNLRRLIDTVYATSALVEYLIVTSLVSADKFGDQPHPWVVGILAFGSASRVLTIAANMRTAYLSGWELIGDEVDEFGQMMGHYVGTWLVFDIFTAVPWDLLLLGFSVTASSGAMLGRILTLVRIPFLFGSSSPLNISRPMSVKGFLFFVYLVAGVHFLACLCIHSGGFDIGGDDVMNGHSFRARYVKAAYWAITTMTTVGYGDITPTTDGARVLAGVTMLVGAGLFAYVMGNISTLLINEDPFKVKIKQQKKSLAGVFRYYQIPIALQKEAFCIFPIIIDKVLTQTEETLGAMPPYLRDKFMHQIKVRLVASVPLFKGAPTRVLSMLAVFFEHRVVSPQVYVVRQGDHGEEMFILNKGMVDVLVADDKGEEKRVVSIKPGSWFGEVALLRGCTRTASVRTSTGCELFVLHRKDFKKIMRFYPGLRKRILGNVQVPDSPVEAPLKRAAGPPPVSPMEDLPHSTGVKARRNTPVQVSHAHRFGTDQVVLRGGVDVDTPGDAAKSGDGLPYPVGGQGPKEINAHGSPVDVHLLIRPLEMPPTPSASPSSPGQREADPLCLSHTAPAARRDSSRSSVVTLAVQKTPS
eukprot:TRINITY_DN23586_c0_g1_i1.p1 TRINITY_DN23586_c0_g1~~TRINITY_DN23586_c0_g1_i1.p1  ORF type:complete len:923 (+),score=161.23 TRINITY_DN23586_c0_g1_i1:388-2769(+)